jgi:hypothetical protein
MSHTIKNKQKQILRSSAEQRKENSNRTAQRYELLVSDRIESPETIQSRASPKQSSGGETRHNGTKEQENADPSKSWRLRPDSEIEPVRSLSSTC